MRVIIMNPYYIFLLFLVIDMNCFSQISDFEKYYPSDSTIKKNKVKKQSDTIGQKIIIEFDKSGREISWYYEKNDTTKTKYVNSKDTLVQIHYSASNTTFNPPFEVEKYIYNKS